MSHIPISHPLEKMALFYCNHLLRYLVRLRLDKIDILLWRIANILSNLFQKVYVLYGIEKHSHEKLKVLYVGNNHSLNYIAKIMFEHNPYIVEKKSLPINKTKSLPYKIKADMFIICCDRFFSRYLSDYADFIIPEWLNFELDTSEPLTIIASKFLSGARKDVKRIVSKKYTYQLTGDPMMKKLFYKKMFLPHIMRRYKDEILPHYPAYIRHITDAKGMKLLLVKDISGKSVAGGLVRFSRERAILPSMGILDGKEEYLRNYAVAALFYFHILVAKQHGIKRINFGNTRSFLNDGNFQFKRKWGMELSLSNTMTNIYLLKVLNLSPAVESFLANNPFVFMDPVSNDLMGFLYTEKVNVCDLVRYIKKYFTYGMKRMYICSPAESDKDISSQIETEIRNSIPYPDFEIHAERCKLLNREMVCLQVKKKPF